MTEKTFNENTVYFVPLSPIDCFGLSGSGDEEMVECHVKPYSFNGYKYKLYAVPVASEVNGKLFGKRTFYTEDFISLIDDGIIVEKTSPNQCYKTITAAEKITDGAYIVHTLGIIE